MSAPKKIVIFDFDGTLADTAPIIRSLYKDLAVKHNFRPLTDSDYAMLRKGTLGQARRWSGMKWWQFPLAVRSVRRLIALAPEKVKLFPGITDLIKELHADEIELYILSRNSSTVINRVLERYKIQKYIKVLKRRKRSLGGKARVISSIISKHGVPPKSVIMIGDEIRDLQAANRAGVRSIAVTWGLQDESILLLYKPTHLVDNVEALKAQIRAM